MYDLLVKSLEEKNDLSFSEIVEKINNRQIDKEVLDHMKDMTDFISFFDACQHIQRSSLLSSSITSLLILTKINLLPTLRTSRYI